MSQRLSGLLGDLDVLEATGETEIEITSVESDSRKAGAGSLFVAVRGVATDAHKFIPGLKGKGVAAVVCEEIPSAEDRDPSTVYIRVNDSADALGRLASAWYGHPSSQLKLVGVTGTNGKTTTATLLYEMAKYEGYKAGLLSTVCNYVHDRAIPATHTTPDPLSLNELLAEMVEAGCDYAFMEVSSHAAHQHRISGLKFAGGVFSNLTRDHMDYHKTVENYMNAKKMFFDMLPEGSFALVNADDKSGMYMVQNTKADVYTYSLRGDADFKCKIIETRLDGTLLQLNGKDIEVNFTGRFNAYNLTAVYGASVLTGFPREEVDVNMSKLVPVAGRFQTFRSERGVTAIVDYAHTPDALVNVLDTIREIVGSDGGILTVVGAGGNRDHGKRPMMALEAAKRSDRLILTSDNPRDEEPDAIIADMKAGLRQEDIVKTLSITDRREAIRTAVALAQPGEVILIAGKGHEPYQEVKGVRHHFDDREEVQAAFEGVK